MEFVESKPGKLVFARFFEEEDLLDSITKVAEKTKVPAGVFFLIGTLKNAKMGFLHEGKYETVEMNQPVEIVSCVGNISMKEKRVFAHAHIAVSDEKGRVYGGHVMPGCIIAATGELVLIEAVDISLRRRLDEKTKLHLWSFGKRPSKSAKKSSVKV